LEFNFDDPNRSQPADSISSDRLRKAIERNRAKQAKRSRTAAGASSRGTVDLNSASSRTSASDRSGFNRPGSGLPGRGRSASSHSGAGRTSGTSASMSSSSSGGATRRNVARPGEQEFATSVRRNVQKPPADVSYVSSTQRSRATRAKAATVVPATTRRTTRTTRSTTTRRKISAKAEKRTRYFVMGCWVLLGVMCLRLVFSRGGVIDYYANKGLLEGKVEEHQSIQVENKTLLKEIKKIRSSKGYQKKLVRDHLGFIAKDEFLILFSTEKS